MLRQLAPYALVAACAMPQEDYVAINTNPQVAIVGEHKALARSSEDLRKMDEALDAHDRKILGLDEGTSATSLAGKTIPLANALAVIR